VTSRAQFLSVKTQAGQAVVLIGLMIIVLFGAIGLAIDGGVAYYYNAAAERAAAAGALSGVIFMPAQLTPASALPAASGNDATDRAVLAAKRNGFDMTAPNTNNNVVTVAAVPGYDNKLDVTVSRTVKTFFMQIFGINQFTVSRTAEATYLPPLKLGQPGGSVGSSVSQLGNTAQCTAVPPECFYFLRTEGWITPRSQGDGYTPAPGGSSDFHAVSANALTDSADPSLPFNGGYNYMITVPNGSTAQIQVYNAAFAPDGLFAASTQNFCENWKTGAGRQCSPGGNGQCTGSSIGCNYYMHEDDSAFNNVGDFGTTNLYSAMKYTIFSAPSVFIRSSDTELSQMLVKPVDATNWSPNPPTYRDVNTGNTITQQYAGNAPSNMSVYHAWMNVGYGAINNTCVGGPCGSGNRESEASIVSYTGAGSGGALGPGTYRLRIDTLEADGSNPCNATGTVCTGQSYAHKGLAVRVLTSAGGVCAGCTMSALDDMAIFTPIDVAGAGNFQIPIVQLPPDYAGQTISVDIFDPGDVGGGGNVYLGLIDPTTNALLLEPAVGQPATVWNLGNQRSNYPLAALQVGNYQGPGQPLEQQVVCGGCGGNFYNGNWLHYEIPIPATYNPGVNPNNWWWRLQYRTTGTVHAVDTITITLTLQGNPAHLVKS
jgi:hypothetical protein